MTAEQRDWCAGWFRVWLDWDEETRLAQRFGMPPRPGTVREMESDLYEALATIESGFEDVRADVRRKAAEAAKGG